jgi:multiple sugar transport system permease protein
MALSLNQTRRRNVIAWVRSPRGREALAGYLFLAPFLFFFVVFLVRPIITSVQMSFHQWEVLMPAHPYVGLANYEELIHDDLWWLALKNTIVFTMLTAAGTTVLALFTALAVKGPVPGQTFYRVVFYAPTLLSVSVVSIIWVWLLNTQFGLVNYVLNALGLAKINWLGDAVLVLPALALTTIWWGFGFPMLIFLTGLHGIPQHLYEAAKIDGAGRLQRFWNVTLPLLRPTILFVTVTQVIAHFQLFGQSFIMTGGGPGRASYSVIMYLYQVAWRYFRMGYGTAIAIGLGAIMLIFTLIQFRLIGARVEY